MAVATYYFSIPNTSLTPTQTPTPIPTKTYPPDSPTSQSTLSPPIPTQLTFSLPATTEAGQIVTITSVLTDSNKQPISGVSVYYVEQQPLGTMLLGGGKTDSNGSTTINFKSTQTGNHQIQVIYSGRSGYFPNSIYSGSSDSKIITITK